MDKKNILFVISSLKRGGGAEKIAAEVAENLKKSGNRVDFLTFYDSEDTYAFPWKYHCLQENISSNPAKNLWKLFSRAYFIARYSRKIGATKCISFMEEANFPNILAKIVFWNQARTIISIRQSQRFIPSLFQLIGKILYPFTDHIVTVSEDEKINLIKNYRIKDEKITTIYNGVNLEKINRLQDEPLDINDDIFKDDVFPFITIGRLTRQKNYPLLIKAFAQIHAEYPETRLLIIGEGEMKEELQKLSTSTDHSGVYFLWKKVNVFPFLKRSNAFILASLWEGFPNVLIEAMACGLPVISTDCPTGPKEILDNGKYGFLIESNNENELYEAMKKLVTDKESRERLSKQSLVRIQDYTLDKMIKKWQEI